MMKKYYRWRNETVGFYADVDDLKQKLQKLYDLLQNYQEIETDLDEDAYVARGNGFCDAKYSEIFIENQINHIQDMIAQVEQWMKEQEKNEN